MSGGLQNKTDLLGIIQNRDSINPMNTILFAVRPSKNKVIIFIPTPNKILERPHRKLNVTYWFYTIKSPITSAIVMNNFFGLLTTL